MESFIETDIRSIKVKIVKLSYKISRRIQFNGIDHVCFFFVKEILKIIKRWR